ncbi:MAG: helix-turn-helix domain-containing protein [Nitrosospira sp.]|nr:helix-turn-helix domain-containing protein [Nitrosospira sp.]
MDAPDNKGVNQGAEPKPAETKQSVGQLLRAARLKRGLSIEDTARQLRLSARQVTALEEDDHAKLASGTFLRGFVRNYAKLLELDAGPLLQQLEHSIPAAPAQTISHPIEGIPFPSNEKHGKRNLIIGVATVLALLMLMYEVYRGGETNVEKQSSITVAPQMGAEQATEAPPLESPGEIAATEPAPPPPAGKAATPEQERVAPPSAPPLAQRSSSALVASGSPDPASPETVKPSPSNTGFAADMAPDSHHAVRLIFEGESWVEARDGRDRLLLSRINPRGTEQVLHGIPPFSLTIGNAAEVRLVYNNKPIDLAPHINAYGGTARLSLN